MDLPNLQKGIISIFTQKLRQLLHQLVRLATHQRVLADYKQDSIIQLAKNGSLDWLPFGKKFRLVQSRDHFCDKRWKDKGCFMNVW